VVQCGAVWCSVVQCGAAWCRVEQGGAVWCSVVQGGAVWCSLHQQHMYILPNVLRGKGLDLCVYIALCRGFIRHIWGLLGFDKALSGVCTALLCVHI